MDSKPNDLIEAAGPFQTWSFAHDAIRRPFTRDRGDDFFYLRVAIDERIQKFTETYCNQCHGRTQQKAGRRFDTLPQTIETIGEIERYQEILDQLNLQSMPPEGERRPTASVQLAMIEHLTERISAALQKLKSEGGHSVLRRINAWEYQQTIGDLLELNVDAWNPAANFQPTKK